jgi:peptidyl-prolyl cis-trans isomerase C
MHCGCPQASDTPTRRLSTACMGTLAAHYRMLSTEMDRDGIAVSCRPSSVADGLRLCDANPMHRPYILAAIAALASCKKEPTHDSRGAHGEAIVLAQVDDITITSADLREILSRYANQPFVLARYSSIEKKKELLDSLIRYDVLAIEARKRGYEHDPEVVRVAKDKMVRLFTQQEINDKVKPADIAEAEVEKYYKDHAGDYVRPETVRVSQIVVKAPLKATKVLAEAKALPKNDMKAFRDLVAKYSEDADSRQRGGDLMLFDRKSTLYPTAAVAASFSLKETGDLSDLVSTPQGFAILKLTERRPALSRSLEESKAEIQRRLLDDLRNRKKKELVDEARKFVKVEIFEDQLAKLDLPAMAGGPGKGATGELAQPTKALDAGTQGAQP